MKPPDPPNGEPPQPPDGEPLDELLRRHAAGDPDALDPLLRRVKAWLDPYVRNELRGTVRSREQTQDVVQEVLQTLLAHIGHLDDADNLRRLAARIVDHTLVDLYKWHTSQRRDVRKERDIAGSGDGTDQGVSEDTATPPPLAADRTEMQIRTRLVLQRLSPSHRQIMELLDLQQRSAVDVAKDLGVTPETVRTRHHRARIEFSKAWVREYGRGG